MVWNPEKGHIINGHVPVHQSEGESPVKCDGKVIVIDGGFSKPYQKVTGIAGYTLIYNSYGLNLTAHEPFTSKADAVARETDIVSNRVAVSYMSRRQLVGDTDTGHALKERIQELIQLLDAYRTGIIQRYLMQGYCSHTTTPARLFWHEYDQNPETYKTKIPLPQAIWNVILATLLRTE